MTNKEFRLQIPKAFTTVIAVAAFLLLPALAMAQTTAGGTIISNQASGAYQDDAATSYSTLSNTVTVTVANVSGLAITPDGTSISTVVPGQTGVVFPFTVTNTSNNAALIHFLASGASIQTTRGAVTAAFVDYNGNGVFDSGTDLDILGNNSAVDTSSIASNASLSVVVVVTVSSSATAAQIVTVQLGDAGGSSPFDEQVADSSAHEVSTNSTGISPAPVNGESEARGTLNATVDADASLRVMLSASSAGPLGYSADITYTTNLENLGTRPASTVSLSGNAGVYIVATIPGDTKLKAGQTWPAGTLFTADALTTANLNASYSTTQPAAGTVTRVAFLVGASLAATTTSGDFNYVVTIDAGPFNTTLGIRAYTDAYATNYLGNPLTDRAGDNLAASAGAPVVTSVTQVGNVQIGTSGHSDASNTTTNDDYTNKSVNTGIAGVVFGSNTTADGTVVYANTLKNTGNADDTFTLTAPAVPSGFTVEISTNAGTDYTDVSNGTSFVTVAIAYNSTANVLVRITEPAGNAVLSSFNTVIHAVSGITPANENDTIDRLYTGFIRLTKTAVVTNETGKGESIDPVPGAVITFSVAYVNIASTGGTNCVTLNASNLVITEDGAAGSNNWATYTSHVVSSATDSRSGTITGNASTASGLLTDTVASLLAGQSGTFSFQRLIK
ncbi:MAG: hypothetical protein QOG23_4818 [Blastocatellia bacterium]|jgi:hypothetical protein|nr:hypothetical protein [Blastocatellia bacterium]